jgi:CDP-6-deoxy-D-xylo-4-hexulose-3-dehydrase
MKQNASELKAEISRLSREYAALVHSANLPSPKNEFIPGKTVIPYAGRVFDADEVEAAVQTTLDFWLTLGPEGEHFEKELANYLGIKRSILTNSGSSANLVAFSALTSLNLGERRIKAGDEVITAAAGFPTTVAPIIQNGAIPVFIDSDPITGNVRVDTLEEAYVPGKTKAIMMAHTLGNPFDLKRVTEFCKKHDLWLIEDNCDALGSTYRTNQAAKPQWTGTFGDLSTQSFYPPHHMTLGEGGAVNVIKDMKFKILVESFRDWGRDCWCASGKDNTCNKRFGWKLGELPEGYDHKYIYSHIGYNLKPLDIQAAIGRQQLRKLPSFIEARKKNWQFLRSELADLEEFFDFALPTHAKKWTKKEFIWDSSSAECDPSWFGFMLLIKSSAPFTRHDFVKMLDEAKIGSRMLFGGNLIRQPAFVNLRKENPRAYRVIGELKGADRLMNETVFIGVYPGLSVPMLEYVVDKISDFCSKRKK